MSTMTNFPSFRTIREWTFDTLPLERTTSLPASRPMVISALSNSYCCWSPSFSATVMTSMGRTLPLSVEDVEADLAPRLLVAGLDVVDHRPDLVRVRVHDPRRDED